ncbi:hypothetical protein B0H63DRAFT_559929 [Podospora didyma]|uniref:Uncharacterized protein n=1 Tax=Podospora didyma TaxID=330526 RepID=A0AAE0NPG5_9PEZI|nr:hypothetical protein B0H63DRAFT_559929 [Podospora didyma]
MGDSEQQLLTRADITAIVRQSYRQSARHDGDDNQLWATAWSKWQSTNARFYLGRQSAESLEWDMHNLWYLFYEASINISEEHPAADRLAMQVITAREQGLLIRDVDPGKGTDDESLTQATTADGNVWTDLPFLVSDMTKYWLEEHAGLSSAQRLRFSNFLAKLAAAGVGRDDGLCRIALATFRQALETPRHSLGTSADQQQAEDASRLEAQLTIAAYLPSVNSWLNWASLKIIQLSETGKSWIPAAGSSEHEEELGGLFQHDVVVDTDDGLAATPTLATTGTASLGFSVSRWIFWLTRLESLAESFRDSGEDALAGLATGMMDNMLIVADATGGKLKKNLEAAYQSGKVQHGPANKEPPSRLPRE